MDDPEPGSGSSPRPQAMTVVGVGASAGGLAALKTLFDHVPEDSGMAFVVVIHLSPEHESHLADLLRPHVKMEIRQVTESVRLEADRVYVIPPNVASLWSIEPSIRLSPINPPNIQPT
jgi:two-component system CheB/CheR fusion protein